ncbi:MAG: hypothetical protein MK135_16460, partial [Polyangiaceae bacterium]|nr:hypothetical protein [Polyangiaceae bacterium]
AFLIWPAALGGFDDSVLTIGAAVVLWHLGGALDAADGALARYRGVSSLFGRFYDKVSDRLVTLALVISLSARAFVHAPADGWVPPVLYVFGAMLYVAGMSACSVAKWVELSLGIEARLSQGGAAGKAGDPQEVGAPSRTPREWFIYVLRKFPTLFIVTEMDLPLWGSLALVFGREDWLFIYLGLYAMPYTFYAISLRARRIRALDREATVSS